ncbi:MAG: metallophosphoesterase [Vallitaleaceae bacterium]|nr:metallophosphoesterase [Vallitaleaceae bacterium]
MQKIIITGDIHMEFGRLNELINKKKPDLIICCGDFGYWPHVKWGEPLTNIKLQGTDKVLWCDGNHEDHWALQQRETDELAPGIIYMPRGSTYTLDDGRTIMFMGGADSIDKQWRTIGIDWFPEEIITYKDLEGLPDIKVDIFITHTCPNELVLDLIKHYPEKNYEPSNQALSELWSRYKPDLWFFGHWHHYKELKMMETRCYALSAPGFGDRWWMWLSDSK